MQGVSELGRVAELSLLQIGAMWQSLWTKTSLHILYKPSALELLMLPQKVITQLL